MDHLRFLRKKEGQLRKEKILFIQGEIFRMDQSRSVSGKKHPIYIVYDTYILPCIGIAPTRSRTREAVYTRG